MNIRMLALICGLALFTTTAVYASDTMQMGRQVKVNGRMLDTQVQITSDGTTITSTRAVAEALGADVTWDEPTNTVEIKGESRLQYANFVTLLLHGKYSLKYEVIGRSVKGHPDTTVVFSDGYTDVPDNTDLQKLFLLVLVDQIGDIPSEKIEFWSNKELAEAYVKGNYSNQVQGLEGWLGLNARFGLLTKEGGSVSLSHIVSPHERDNITIGKYK